MTDPAIVPFDWSYITRCLDLAGTPPVIFELGTYDGADTRRIYAACRQPLQYFTFEPDPRNVSAILASGLPSGVMLVPAAIGAVEGEATLYLSAGNWTASSSLRKPFKHLDVYPYVAFAGEVKVRITTLDGFCDQHGIDHIDFVWADIQGAERDMIAGGSKILMKTKFMFLERMHDELYEGQWVGEDTVKALAEDWGVVANFPDDILLYNRRFR